MGANVKAAICILFAAFALLAANTKVARAQPAPAGLSLRWEAPAGCPQESEVRRRFRALITPIEAQKMRLSAEGTITPIDGGFRMKLIVNDGQSTGERTIDSASCTDFAGAAAVALRLLARFNSPEPEHTSTESANASNATNATGDPASKSATPPASASAAAAPPPPPAEVREPPPVSAKPTASVIVPELPTRVDEPSDHRWHFVLRAPIFVTDVGPASSPSVGYGLALGIRPPSWLILLAGRRALTQSMAAADNPNYGATVDRLTAELFACRTFTAHRVEFAPCLLFAADRMNAQGYGENIVSRTQHPAWWGAGAAVMGSWYPVKWASLFVSLGGRVQGSRPIIVLDQIGTVHQVSPFAFTAAIGSEWIF